LCSAKKSGSSLAVVASYKLNILFSLLFKFAPFAGRTSQTT